MRTDQFDYDLPPELIAAYPARRRDQSRLLVLDRTGGAINHRRFSDIVCYLRAGDALVINDTRVFKARLFAHRVTGGQVELLLVRRIDHRDGETWEALVQPAGRIKAGEALLVGAVDPLLMQERLPDGRWVVQFQNHRHFMQVLATAGHVPLPPYIDRADAPTDVRRYQTVYAAKGKSAAVAAPTAGFHFTVALLKTLRERGVIIVPVTLHVGPGTFKPIKSDEIEEHRVDPEWSEVSAEAALTLNRIRSRGGKIVAVGTTAVRTLESSVDSNGSLLPRSGMVDLYIRPEYTFRFVDHLITNFHLPRSSLLVLVAALAGRERILGAYREAIARKYRFYSYGDAMLVL